MTITRAYQEQAIQSADSVELVLMLHDMMIEDLRRCVAAVRNADVQARTAEASHALAVLDQLQRGIDEDHGGEAAACMERLYNIVRGQLLTAQIRCDPEGFERLQTLFTSLRDAWKQAHANRTHQFSPTPQALDNSIPPPEQRVWTV